MISEAESRLNADEILKHRIGIHLGDVFLSKDNVMGDGVNIAARLQQTAEPGGICFSQTVYDVVKNRMALKAIYIGPTELKNIREKVPVYQIVTDAARAGNHLASDNGKIAIRRWQTLILGIGTAALVLIAVGIAFFASQHGAAPAPDDTRTRPTNPTDEAPRPAPPTASRAAEPPNPRDTFEPGRRLPRGTRGPPLIDEVLKQFDSNHDGLLTRDEVPSGSAKRFFQADTNNDGVLTREELSRAPRRRRPPRGDRGT